MTLSSYFQSRSLCRFLLLLSLSLCCFSCIQPVQADIYDISEDILTYANPILRRVVGMYAPEDNPEAGGSKSNPSFVQLNVKFFPVGDSSNRYGKNTAQSAQNTPKWATQDENTPATTSTATATPTSTSTPTATAAADGSTAATESPSASSTGAAVPSTDSSTTPVSASAPPSSASSTSTNDTDVVLPPVTGFVQVLIYQSTSIDLIGYKTQRGTEYCCTSDLMQLGVKGCEREGSLIMQADPSTYHLFDATFDNNTIAIIDGQRFNITTTSEHLLVLASCDVRVGNVRVEGEGIWRNPYGYLPGRLYGFLPFYLGTMIIFAFVTFVWLLWNLYYWKMVAGVQHCITLTLFMCVAETASWFADYNSFNIAGRRNMGIVITAIFFTVLRLTVSRVLVVSVSLGYPVVRPTLGTAKIKIFCLSILYFACEVALELVTRYSQTNETAKKWRVFLSLPVAIFNAIFYWWIFTSIHDLLAYLEQHKQNEKLSMYKKFTHVLVGSLVAAVAFAAYQIYFMTTNQLALHWSLLWLLDGGFALILYTIIFLVIAFLWRPSTDSRRYAYAELSLGENGALGGNPGSPDDEEDDNDEFGDIEMANAGDSPSHHKQSHANGNNHHHNKPRFTVDEPEDDPFEDPNGAVAVS